MTGITRLPIPSLGENQFKLGHSIITHRSFRFGESDFTRLYHDEPLVLEVAFSEKEKPPHRVYLSVNIGVPGQTWQDIPFHSHSGHRYSLRIKFPHAGLFRFKVKYSYDGDSLWYWDRVPYSCVLVDPTAMRGLRLYTLIPTATGTIREWERALYRIRDMGFDSVHLLPFTQMGRSLSPYSAADLFSIHPDFLDEGGKDKNLEQFERFVDLAVKLNIRLCLDLVLNHVAADSHVATTRPDWIITDEAEPDGLKRAGCWHMHSWIRWDDLVLINYDHPDRNVRKDIWNYMRSYALFWSNYAAYTGGIVRIDNLHSSNTHFIRHMSNALHHRFPDLVIFAEYFTDQVTLEKTVPLWRINLLLANIWEYPFTPQLRDYIRYVHQVSDRLRHLMMITTHDTGVPAQLFGSHDSIIPRHTVAALMGLGQVGMVQGVESGVENRLPFIGGMNRVPLETGRDYRPFIMRINEILMEHDAFQSGKNILFIDDNHPAIIGVCRLSPVTHTPAFLIFVNLDVQNEQTIHVDTAQTSLPRNMTLLDMMSGEHIRQTGPVIHVSLKPCGIAIFKVEHYP